MFFRIQIFPRVIFTLLHLRGSSPRQTSPHQIKIFIFPRTQLNVNTFLCAHLSCFFDQLLFINVALRKGMNGQNCSMFNSYPGKKKSPRQYFLSFSPGENPPSTFFNAIWKILSLKIGLNCRKRKGLTTKILLLVFFATTTRQKKGIQRGDKTFHYN